MSPSFVQEFRRQVLRIAGGAQRLESPTAVLDALSAQLRSLVQKRGAALARRGRNTRQAIEIVTPAVPANEAVAAHLATLVHKRLARLVESRHLDTANGPVDAVHDLRVASRRLRAVVDVFDPILDRDLRKRARKSLRAITRAARVARDLDVQLSYLREYYSRTTADIERAALEELIARTDAQRRGEVRRLRKRLRRLDWQEIKACLSAVLGTAVTHLPANGPALSNLTWELLEPLARVNHTQTRSLAEGEPFKDLHEFRIQLKKLRYALELFEPVLGAAFDSLYDPVQSAQEFLGHHRDLFVLEESIRGHRRNLEHENRTTLAFAVEALETKLTERRHALYEDYRRREFDLVGWQHALRARLQQVSTA